MTEQPPDEMEQLVDEVKAGIKISRLATSIYYDNCNNGFWEEADNPLILPAKVALVMTELAKIVEGDRRHDQADTHLPQYRMIDVELADSIIRLLDLAGWRGCDIGQIVLDKLEYNRQRGVRHGGKKY